MQMNVKNLLTRGLAMGQKESDAFTLNWSRWHGQGNSLRDLKEMRTYVRRQIGKVPEMDFRHYQDMAGVDRLDIHEGQANIIFIDSTGLHFVFNDLTKDTGFH